MRDLPEKRFAVAADFMGFPTTVTVTAEGLRFIAADGVQVEPVLHPGTVRRPPRHPGAHVAGAQAPPVPDRKKRSHRRCSADGLCVTTPKEAEIVEKQTTTKGDKQQSVLVTVAEVAMYIAITVGWLVVMPVVVMGVGSTGAEVSHVRGR